MKGRSVMDLETIKGLRKNLVFLSLVELICGLFMIIYNNNSIEIVIKVFGIVAAAYGVITFLAWLFKKDKSGTAGTIILLAVCLVAGLCLIFLTEYIKPVFTYITGATMIVYGIVKLPNVFKLRRGGFKKWAVGLIPVTLIVVLGAVVIVLNSRAQESYSIIAFLLGIGFILGCASDIITMAGASIVERELENGSEVDAEQEKLQEKKK